MLKSDGRIDEPAREVAISRRRQYDSSRYGNPARSPSLAIQSSIADKDKALKESVSLPEKPRTEGRKIGVLRIVLRKRNSIIKRLPR